MNTRNPDFITVDLRGLKAALVSCAKARRESVSVLVRRAVALELGQSESVPRVVVDTGRFGASHVPRVKLSIRFTASPAPAFSPLAGLAFLCQPSCQSALSSQMDKAQRKHN